MYRKLPIRSVERNNPITTSNTSKGTAFLHQVFELLDFRNLPCFYPDEEEAVPFKALDNVSRSHPDHLSRNTSRNKNLVLSKELIKVELPP